MPSMNEIVERAYRKIGVVAEDEPMNAQQQANGLAALNSMMAAWRSAGVNYDHASTLSGTSEYPLGDRWVRHAVHLLAEEIAPDNATSYATDLLRQLQAGFAVVPKIQTSSVLRNTPSQLRIQRVTSTDG